MFLSPIQVIDYLPLRTGSRVADFGSGRGEYSLALLDKVNREGSVYAFETLKNQVEALHHERVKKDFNNLFSLCVDLNSHIPLKDALLHCSILSNTLHALENRSGFLSELNRVTKPKGSVLVVDWAASFKNVGPTEHQVIAPGEAVRLFKAHGFQTGEMLPAGTHHYAFIATKV